MFEDSQTAVLIQAGTGVARSSMKDAATIDRLLNAFINYVCLEVKGFREAIASFKDDLPTILETLRGLLYQQDQTNVQYQQTRDAFWRICQQSINPAITLLDVIATLNIKFTYQQKMGEYEEFQNICFVDTLDHTSFGGKQGDLFAMSVENTERIKRQNDQDVFVVIGNPPYRMIVSGTRII